MTSFLPASGAGRIADPILIAPSSSLSRTLPPCLIERHKDKGEKAWYFFTPRDRKYKNGTRPNRAVKENKEYLGFWKATGKDTEIKEPKTKAVIALRKTLVYYEKKKNEVVKTNWIMQEYTMSCRAEQSGSAELPSKAVQSESAKVSDMRLDDWVLCKIYLNAKGTKKRRKQEQEAEENKDAAKYPRIEEHVTNAGYDIDEEINKFMEDGHVEFLTEGQAFSSDLMTAPTLPIATESHMPLLMQQSELSQLGSPAMQANTLWSSDLMPRQVNGLPSNGLQPMQSIGPSDFSTPTVQLGGESSCGYPPLLHDQLQNFDFAPLQTSRLPNPIFESIQSSDLMYATEAAQMMQSNGTRNSTIKVENFTDLSGSIHSQFDSVVSQMPPAGDYFQSQASFDEPQLAPFPDSLIDYYYEFGINNEESFKMETTIKEEIEATANEAQFIWPRSFLSPYMPAGANWDYEPSSSNCQPPPSNNRPRQQIPSATGFCAGTPNIYDELLF